MELDEDWEKIEKEEESITYRIFLNMLQNKSYKSDKSFRIKDRKFLDNRIITLNKEQRKISNEILDITEDKILFSYMYGKAQTGKTYLLIIIIPALEFESLKSVVVLREPLVLFISPTQPTTKHLLYGDTIHGSLRMTPFQNPEKQMLHGATCVKINI